MFKSRAISNIFLHLQKNVIISKLLGGCNLPSTPAPPTPRARFRRACKSNHYTRQCNLTQIVKEPIRGNSILDHLTNLNRFYDKPIILDPIGIILDYCL